MTNILAKEMIGLSFPPMMVSKCMVRTKEFRMFSKNEEVKVLRVFEMIEHDGRACIYGAFVSVDTNDILMNDEFPILDVGRKIISEDNGNTSIVNATYCSGKGHYARNCPKPRVRDSKYFMEQILLTKQDEAGVILTNEHNDFLFADASRMKEIERTQCNTYA
ncbi:retrovirus-related pol polyprotein from transposon TNT 1-94 [Tanacetum coccineum]|uniref:Retrovirus-related pol polyprotein from transposon TNT 1-94 n=1 Tax=Tanacetum coccineum TaxID=301880 RepID=A0ABQ5EEG4_9ASTR